VSIFRVTNLYILIFPASYLSFSSFLFLKALTQTRPGSKVGNKNEKRWGENGGGGNGEGLPAICIMLTQFWKMRFVRQKISPVITYPFGSVVQRPALIHIIGLDCLAYGLLGPSD
jgi:hypothetical protein